jgi:hypothetical protein
MKQDRTTKRYDDPGTPGSGGTARLIWALAQIRGWLGMAMDCIWDGDQEVAAGQPAGAPRRAASSAACATRAW